MKRIRIDDSKGEKEVNLCYKKKGGLFRSDMQLIGKGQVRGYRWQTPILPLHTTWGSQDLKGGFSGANGGCAVSKHHVLESYGKNP